MSRRLWLLDASRYGSVRLGPQQRMLDFALEAAPHCEVHLVVTSWEGAMPTGISVCNWSDWSMRKLQSGDQVLTTPFLPLRTTLELLRSPAELVLDHYFLSMVESLPANDVLPRGRRLRGLRRTLRKDLWMTRRASRILFSHRMQMAALAGAFLGLGSDSARTEASLLPAKASYLPMRPRTSPFPLNNPFPYPAQLQGRRILLWGGGIWSWLGWKELLHAMAEVQQALPDVALFFLAGSNPSSVASQNQTYQEAKDLARSLGLLDQSVFFNERPAPSSQLAAYLEHCYAGILVNAPILESELSWRTRFLDLVWAQKPLLLAGHDPLGEALLGSEQILPLEDLGRHLVARLQEPLAPCVWKEAAMLCLSELLETKNSASRTAPSLWDLFKYLIGS